MPIQQKLYQAIAGRKKDTYVIGSVLSDGTFEYNRNGHKTDNRTAMIMAVRGLVKAAKKRRSTDVVEYHVVKLGKTPDDDKTIFKMPTGLKFGKYSLDG